MKQSLICLFFLLAGSAALSSTDGQGRKDSTTPLALYPFLSHFEWREEALNLKEDGWIYGLGVAGEKNILNELPLSGRLELFVGEVDYKGARQDSTAYETKTGYLGIKGELGAGPRLHVGDAIMVRPVVGVGLRAWRRQLDDTDERTYGYDEDWMSAYGLAGADLTWQRRSRSEFFANLYFRRPMYNRESVYISTTDQSSTIILHPKSATSFFAELGWRTPKHQVALFYETLAFDESDSELSGPFEIFQPDSDAQILGVLWGIYL